VTSRAFLKQSDGGFVQKLLVEVCHREKALLMNTGAEAVESAVKVARKWGYQVKGVPDSQAKSLLLQIISMAARSRW